MWLQTILVGVLAAAIPSAQVQPDEESRGPLALKERFLSEVRACGLTPAYEPGLRMETSSAIITYQWEPRTVLIARWNELPDPFKALIAQWAAAVAPSETPQSFFQSSFQDVGVAHELGHWLQHQAGRHRTLSRWDAEVEANRIGIAFAEMRDGPEMTASRMQWFKWLLNLPYEPPQDRNLEHHFNADYDALSRDPIAYGWYQGAIVQEALNERRQGDFCDLVRLNTPNAP